MGVYKVSSDFSAQLPVVNTLKMMGVYKAEYEVSRIYHLNHSEQHQWEERFKEVGITD